MAVNIKELKPGNAYTENNDLFYVFLMIKINKVDYQENIW